MDADCTDEVLLEATSSETTQLPDVGQIESVRHVSSLYVPTPPVPVAD